MKKQRLSLKISAILITFLLALSALISCGDSSNGSRADIGGEYDSVTSSGGSALENGGDSASDASGGIGSIPSGGVDNPSAKIIKTANARMRTETYDAFITELYQKITEFSAYTDGETFGGAVPNRYATITVRIPAEKLEEFKNALNGLGITEHYSAKKQDVSLAYATLKAEVDTLTEEIVIIEELFEIAKEKGNLQEISNLETKLTDLRMRIAKANAQLSVYDNSIAYSTLYLTVNEYIPSETEPEAPEEEKNAFRRIGENLLDAFKKIGNFFVELFVFLVSALPYILLVGVLALIPITVIVLNRKKRKKASDDKDDKKDE